MTALLLQRVLVASLGTIAIHLPLVPVGQAGERIANPDLLFCLLAACVLRRPEAVPLSLVLVLGLLADFILGRAPGPGALGLVLATEHLRRRSPGSFLAEWLRAALLFAAILAGIAALLALTLAPLPGSAVLARYWLATALAYPLVAAALRFALDTPRPGVPR
ncbi:MAG TPA: rod shape-determining protein MreD [Paracoccaceae bacterium]|nr:rod shape-determining protein MreD [Paracoccaceae bacterium]